MKLAIERAQFSISEGVPPNPKVGAVIVRDGTLLGSAFRGEIVRNDHAEFTVLEKKLRTNILSGATLYTTLEPCTERNSKEKIPCAKRIIDRKIARVVIGMLDPNQSICGRGIRRLRDAGIATDLFPSDLMSQVEEQNRDFTRYQETLSEGYPLNRLPSVNPQYDADLRALDKAWRPDFVMSKETLLIIVGENLAVELLDRIAAAILRDAIDERGKGDQFRRAIIMTSTQLRLQRSFQSQPIISVGGPNPNPTTKDIIDLAESRGLKRWGSGSFGIFVRDGQDAAPRVALWGQSSAQDTRRAVEQYIKSPEGLKDLLSMVWR